MKQIVKNFNNLIKRTILKVQNNTNNKLLLFRAQNKTNNKLLISKFNKYLISLISLLFFYLFYLSIPILYDKNWVQKNVENQLLEDFKIHFSLSSDISYHILPSPHYLIKDSKILKENNKTATFASIKILKVFINQKNFFDKNKLSLDNIKINNADFILAANDLKLFKNKIKYKASNKKIEIEKSIIFFKNNLDEIISIVKISKGLLFHDEDNLFNLFELKGKIFNIPFNFYHKNNFDNLNSKETSMIVKKLKLDILNIHNIEKKNSNKGKNIISFLNSKVNTNYKIEKDIIRFKSEDSKLKNSDVTYDAELSIDPFELNANIHLDRYELNKFLNPNSILSSLIKTGLLFNKNINLNTSITTNPHERNKYYQKTKINFNIVDGKININKSRLINKKIGTVELNNSNLNFKKKKLVLNTDIAVNIKNSSELYFLLQTNKKFRKPIKNILINLDYDFVSSLITFNNIKIDNQEINDDLFRIINDFSDNELNNWNKSKRILNAFFKAYSG